MLILKKVFFTFLSILLVYNAINFSGLFMKLSPLEFSSLAIIVSAAAFNLLITGVFAFLGFVYPTSKLLPKSYYRLKNEAQLNSLYKWLGVKGFRVFLLLTFYRKKENKKYFNGTKSGIIQFDYNTRQSEFGHLMAFIFILLHSCFLLFYGHWSLFIASQTINIIFNFYPIILQRKHRISVQRILDRV